VEPASRPAGGDVGRVAGFLGRLQDVEPIDVRHVEVEEHQVDVTAPEHLDAFQSVVAGEDVESLALAQRREQRAHVRVIIDDQQDRLGRFHDDCAQFTRIAPRCAAVCSALP